MSDYNLGMDSNIMELIESTVNSPQSTVISNTSLRVLLRSILDCEGSHQFEVTQTQFDLLNTHAERFQNMSPNDWLDMVWFDDGKFLFSSYTRIGDRANIIEDQLCRARSILQYMIENNLYTLRTMDGHGRFVMCFLKVIRDSGLSIEDYTIELADINQFSSRWHNLFLPTNVRVIENDSTPYISNILDTDKSILSHTCLYFNFCGIGDSIMDLKEFLLDVLNTTENIRIFVSYSRRGSYKTIKRRKRISKLGRIVYWFDSIGEVVSSRGTFYTSILSPIQLEDNIDPDSRKRKRFEL